MDLGEYLEIGDSDKLCCFSEGLYELKMFDLYGDGWNGNVLEIDGIVNATLVHEFGSEDVIEFVVSESISFF